MNPDQFYTFLVQFMFAMCRHDVLNVLNISGFAVFCLSAKFYVV